MTNALLHRFYDNGGHPVAMSHAGATSDGVPAASIASYEAAAAIGYRYLQVDVVRVGGDELVAGHAITGRRRRWEQRSLAELQREHPSLASLSELFEALPEAHWNIEIKSAAAADALLCFLGTRTDALGRVCVSSPFRPSILDRARREFGPSLCTAASLFRGGLFGVPLIPGRPQGDAVQVLHVLAASGRVIDWNARRGVQFQAWPVNDEARMRSLLDRGVGGIITDNHEGLRDVLRERGQWLHQT